MPQELQIDVINAVTKNMKEGNEDDKEFKEKLEVLKEDRKDERVKKQSAEQSKLISQRQGSRGPLPEAADSVDGVVNSFLG